MPRRSAWMATVLLGAGASAQPVLDLQPAQVPGPGAGAGALSLSAQLHTQADALASEETAAAQAGAAIRRLAARLLADGEQAGAAGSTMVLWGRTLADRVPVIEAWLNDRGRPEDATVVALLTADIHRLLAAPAIDQPDVRLRDLFAILAREAGEPPAPHGWAQTDPIAWPGPPVSPDNWVTLGLITPETAESLRALDATLDATASWPVYQRSAARVRALLAAGADAADAPEWIEAPARDAIRRRFNEAALAVCDPASRAAGVEALVWLAAIGDIVTRAERLDGVSPPAAASVKRARAAIGQHLSSQPADPAEAHRGLAATNRILDLTLARGTLPLETRLVRQVRPAYRALLAEARNGEAVVLGALPEALRRADSMTEPGVVAAISRHQRAIDDLRLLAALSAALAEPGGAPDKEPAARTGWEGVSALVLAAGQALSKPELRDSALTELRTLAERLKGSMPLPGEREMERALAAGGDERSVWAELTGGREGELPPDIADRRRVWLAAWGRKQFRESDAEGVRLDNLRLLLDTLRDVAPVHAVIRSPGPGPARDRYEALQAWPGWQLSLESLSRLAEGLPAKLSQATALVLGPEQAEAAAQLGAIRTEYAAVRLAGRLMAAATQLGFVPADGASAVLHEVAAGAPVDVGPGATWLAALRPLIVDVCRYAEEIGAAESLGARDRAAAFRAISSQRAAAALDGLEAVPP